MNTYVKSSELLDRIEAYHTRLTDYYGRCAEETGSERTKMLLDYLAKRERRFAEGVGRFRETTASRAEETWQQYVPATEELRVPDEEMGDGDRSIDEVAGRARALEERLTRFLRVMAGKAGAPEQVKAIFGGLLEQHGSEEANLTQVVTDLKRL